MNTPAHSILTHTRQRYIFSIALFILALFLFAGIPTLFAHYGREQQGKGYGYGYGDTTCSAKAPNGLRAKTGKRLRIAAVLSWKPVQFSNCEKIRPNYYQVKVYNKRKTLIRFYKIIKKNQKKVRTNTFKIGKYTFRVRAIAKDGTKTKWSQKQVFRVVK